MPSPVSLRLVIGRGRVRIGFRWVAAGVGGWLFGEVVAPDEVEAQVHCRLFSLSPSLSFVSYHLLFVFDLGESCDAGSDEKVCDGDQVGNCTA